jgi:hypothetical protein
MMRLHRVADDLIWVPESRGPFMMIDALAPVNSVSAARLSNSAIGMGRPSPLFARCSAHLVDRHRVVSDGGIKPRAKHVVKLL